MQVNYARDRIFYALPFLRCKKYHPEMGNEKYRIAGIFRGRKLSRISRFLNIRESFIREIFGADTVQGSVNIWGAWQIARASCRAAPRAEVSSCSAAGKTSRYQSLMVVMPSSSIRRSCQQGSETDIRVIKP